MTANLFAALLDGVPRMTCNFDTSDGSVIPPITLLHEDAALAALAAAVAADLAEAGKVLEEPQPRTLVIHHKTPCGCASARGSTGDCRTGIVRCNKCRKQIDRIEIVPNPDFDPTPLPDPKNVIRALLARIAAQEAQIKGLVGDLAEVEALEMQHGAVIERLETALAASEAKVARLVEAGKALSKACEGEVEEVFLGEIGNELSKFRAAITEAGQ